MLPQGVWVKTSLRADPWPNEGELPRNNMRIQFFFGGGRVGGGGGGEGQ